MTVSLLVIHRRLLYTTGIGVALAGLILCFYLTAARPPLLHTAWAQEPAAPSSVTTIRWLMRWDEVRVQQIALPLIAAFEQQNPTIHVELQNINSGSDYERTLNLALSQGDGPDVFYPSTLVAYRFALQEMLLPLAPWIAADQLDLNAFDAPTLALYRTAAHGVYCLPADIATLAVFYNKEHFDAAGLPYPTAPWRWDDFLATAQQLTQDVDGDGITESYGVDRFDAYWPLLVWTATGHNVFDDPYAPAKFLLEDKAAITALQWLADLSLVHGVMPPIMEEEEGDSPDRFLTGEAAMQITGHWRIPTYLAEPDLHFDFVELPAGNFRANRSDGSCFAIARNTAQPEAAWAFVKFLAGPGAQGAALLTARQQMTPALLDLQASTAFRNPSVLPQSNKAAFLPETDVRFALYDPLHPIYRRWAAVTDEALDELWTGAQSAEEVVATLAEEAEEIVDNLPAEALADEGRDAQAGSPSPTPPPAPVADNTVMTSPLALPRHFYVAPQGNDQNAGESPLTAFATLQQALDHVQPGDTVHLLAGDYFENVVSVVDGRADAPITLMGASGAVLHGAGEASAAFYLSHDYYTLVGFTLDGLFGNPDEKDGYTDKLLYVQGKQPQQGVTGLRVLNMTFQNAGGECLRLRYFAHQNEIAYSTFLSCGLFDFAFADGGKNGEAIYIGTSSTQWADGKNPTAEPDNSQGNWVHHNLINTQGNECVEIKEGGSANLIEHNTCTGQLDPDSAGIGARGNHNIIRYNRVYANMGAGVRLGGHKVDGIQYGVENHVYANQLLYNVAGGINVAVGPQAQICGNSLERNWGKGSFGDASEDYDPTEPCQQ